MALIEDTGQSMIFSITDDTDYQILESSIYLKKSFKNQAPKSTKMISTYIFVGLFLNLILMPMVVAGSSRSRAEIMWNDQSYTTQSFFLREFKML